MSSAVVEHIHIAPAAGAPVRAVDSVEARAGHGLVGDRYAEGVGQFSREGATKQQVTLIEAEAIEAAARDHDVALAPGATRRNITVRGAALNHLVGRTFDVGSATLRGVELCEPCGHMEKLCGQAGARKALIHRGGLRCEVVAGGTIAVGDPLEASG